MAMILTQDTFEEKVLKASRPVLVDFFATWCGPCKMLAPILEALAPEYEGRVDIYKLDIDQAMDLCEAYEVVSVPTLILFKNGQPVQKIVGLAQKPVLAAMLDQSL